MDIVSVILSTFSIDLSLFTISTYHKADFDFPRITNQNNQ